MFRTRADFARDLPAALVVVYNAPVLVDMRRPCCWGACRFVVHEHLSKCVTLGGCSAMAEQVYALTSRSTLLVLLTTTLKYSWGRVRDIFARVARTTGTLPRAPLPPPAQRPFRLRCITAEKRRTALSRAASRSQASLSYKARPEISYAMCCLVAALLTQQCAHAHGIRSGAPQDLQEGASARHRGRAAHGR